MDILMIVLLVYGAGLLTVGARAAIKDGVSQLDEVKRADAQVKSKTKTKTAKKDPAGHPRRETGGGQVAAGL